MKEPALQIILDKLDNIEYKSDARITAVEKEFFNMKKEIKHIENDVFKTKEDVLKTKEASLKVKLKVDLMINVVKYLCGSGLLFSLIIYLIKNV